MDIATSVRRVHDGAVDAEIEHHVTWIVGEVAGRRGVVGPGRCGPDLRPRLAGQVCAGETPCIRGQTRAVEAFTGPTRVVVVGHTELAQSRHQRCLVVRVSGFPRCDHPRRNDVEAAGNRCGDSVAQAAVSSEHRRIAAGLVVLQVGQRCNGDVGDRIDFSDLRARRRSRDLYCWGGRGRRELAGNRAETRGADQCGNADPCSEPTATV